MSDSARDPIRIATRASRLARWQAHHVASLLSETAPNQAVEIVHISTIGDRDQDHSLADFGGVGVFTKEVQNAVLDGRADVAVHSLKDLPTEAVDGLVLAAVPQRGPRFDVLVLPQDRMGEVVGVSHDVAEDPLQLLAKSARVATGSLRRQAQLLHHRADLELCEVRGNVETRLRKLDEGQFDALILAEAGLNRLGLQDRISAVLSPPRMYPAVSQGALGIECRSSDESARMILKCLTNADTFCAVSAERSLLAALRAGCHAPLGVDTKTDQNGLWLEAVVLSPMGEQKLVASATRAANQAVELGEDVATKLRDQGADAIIHASG